jgi:hypothetical protein
MFPAWLDKPGRSGRRCGNRRQRAAAWYCARVNTVQTDIIEGALPPESSAELVVPHQSSQ